MSTLNPARLVSRQALRAFLDHRATQALRAFLDHQARQTLRAFLDHRVAGPRNS